MAYLSRIAWRARTRRRHPGTLDRGAVVGLAFHWPAMSKPVRGIRNVSAALRGWQDYHMDEHGWSDIAYQVAVDQDGNRYGLRGLRRVSAANGGRTVNLTYGAVLLVLAPGETPSPAMVRTVRRIVRQHRRIFPGSRHLVGHGEIRPSGPTDCPGAAVRAALDAGVFEP